MSICPSVEIGGPSTAGSSMRLTREHAHPIGPNPATMQSWPGSRWQPSIKGGLSHRMDPIFCLLTPFWCLIITIQLFPSLNPEGFQTQ